MIQPNGLQEIIEKYGLPFDLTNRVYRSSRFLKCSYWKHKTIPNLWLTDHCILIDENLLNTANQVKLFLLDDKSYFEFIISAEDVKSQPFEDTLLWFDRRFKSLYPAASVTPDSFQ